MWGSRPAWTVWAAASKSGSGVCGDVSECASFHLLAQVEWLGNTVLFILERTFHRKKGWLLAWDSIRIIFKKTPLMRTAAIGF